MAVGDWPALSGGIGGSADPWAERDKLVAGDPVEITGLARAFAKAAGQAQLATELGRQGSRLTAEGYRVGGMSVHDIDENVARTRRLLGDSGENMTRVANILDGISDDLSIRTTAAKKVVAELESQLAAKQRAWTDYEGRYQAALAQPNLAPTDRATLVGQHAIEQQKYQDSSVDLVTQLGTRIARSVGDYDAALGKRVRDLQDMGYEVPAEVAEGPGDITGDPDAGRRDGEKIAGLLGQPPGKQTLAEMDSAAAGLRALNEKVARGGRLTDAERAYMTQLYDTLGTDNLAKLPQVLRDAAPAGADLRRGPDGSPIRSGQAVYDSAMAPFRDSLMNLSAGIDDKGNGIRFESLPRAVQQLVDGTHLGIANPATGLRMANDRFLQIGGQPDMGEPDLAGYRLGGGVAGMDRYQALAELTKSRIAPGTDTAVHLADAGLRGKQELNAIQAQTRVGFAYTAGGVNDDAVHRLDALMDDTPASTLLSAAARSHSGSSAVLLDDTRRAEVMGLNWKDGTGAAEVVHSGTERDPRLGGGNEVQANAAMAVVHEVAGDRDGYLSRMGDPMKSAVSNVGIEYVDALAQPSVRDTHVEAAGLDAAGRPLGPTFQLSRPDRDHYLQFVSGTGDDNAAAFQAKTLIASRAAIGDAFAHGDVAAVHTALADAGRLDGAVTQANFDYKLDQVDNADKVAQAAVRADQIRHKAIATAATVGTAVIGGAVTVATAGTGAVLVGPAIAVTSALTNGAVGFATMDGPGPRQEVPRTKEELIRQDGPDYELRRDMLLASSMRDAHLFDGGHEPRILSYDADGDGVVSTPADLGTDAQRQRELRPALLDAVDRWEATHRVATSSGGVDLGEYENGRHSAFSGAWDGAGAPARSAWSDHPGELNYGESGPSGRIPDRLDPRLLDDPGYDPVRGEHR